VDERLILLLRRALALVRSERPQAYAAMASCLSGLSVSLSFAADLHLRSDSGEILEHRSNEAPSLRFRADRAALQALVAGRVTLNDSLRAGTIDAVGTTDALSRALCALEYFVCALLTIEDAENLRTALEGL
jgi:hypothetical protein